MKQWMAPVAVVALAVAAGIWFQERTFTITRTVPVVLDGPTIGGDAALPRELRVRCGTDGDYYVSDTGEMLFWGSGSPPHATPICDDARSDRHRGSVAIGLVGLLAALGLLLYRRVAVNGREREHHLAGVHAGQQSSSDS